MLTSIIHELKVIVNRHDDDAIDRYSHRYTVMGLAVFIFLIATKQYFGEPIICWTPAQFTGSHTAYANAVCWTHGTYPVGQEQPYHTVDRTQVLPYYQWVPFILLFQAFCFFLPNMIWHSLSKQTGIDVSQLMKNAAAADNMDTEKRDGTIEQIARHIHISLSLKYDYEPFLKRFNIRKKLPIGKRHGNYLFILYIFVKILYLLNVIGQLFLMNLFFGFRYHSYGFDFVKKFVQGEDYSRIDLAFPRVTFCDFKIRNMGDNIHQHSVQCTLPINLFNEKFFICLWFWMIALAILTMWNFVKWLFVLSYRQRRATIVKYLKTQHKYGDTEKERMILESFINDYCHLDGAFIFSLTRRNTNFITTSEIICALWTKYNRDYTRSVEMKSLRDGGHNSKSLRVDVEDETDRTPLNPSKSSV